MKRILLSIACVFCTILINNALPLSRRRKIRQTDAESNNIIIDSPKDNIFKIDSNSRDTLFDDPLYMSILPILIQQQKKFQPKDQVKKRQAIFSLNPSFAYRPQPSPNRASTIDFINIIPNKIIPALIRSNPQADGMRGNSVFSLSSLSTKPFYVNEHIDYKSANFNYQNDAILKEAISSVLSELLPLLVSNFENAPKKLSIDKIPTISATTSTTTTKMTLEKSTRPNTTTVEKKKK
jgi:hypothetical protein